MFLVIFCSLPLLYYFVFQWVSNSENHYTVVEEPHVREEPYVEPAEPYVEPEPWEFFNETTQEWESLSQ